MKKILTLVSIICLLFSAFIGICYLLFPDFMYSNNILNNNISKILLTTLIIFVCSLLTSNSIYALESKNKLGLISLSSVLFSGLLFLLSVWIEALNYNEVYFKTTFIIALISILFNVIVSKYIVIKNKYLFIQLIIYFSLFYLELHILFLLFNVDNFISSNWVIFGVMSIIFISFSIVLHILTKQINIIHEQDKNKKYIKIPLEEYYKLLDELNELKEKVNK